jgi:CheY-like chemotaxis protein
MPMNQNNLKILLVDDVDFFRVVMRDYFKRTPATLFTANDGEEAIRLALRESPDLIYMDVTMPGMSGIEACKRIKSHPSLNKIPVLLIFTPNRDATIKDIEASGCDGYLAKPFGREEFLNLGHRYLFNIERRERRVPCQMTVEFSINDTPYKGRGTDISLHGLYVEFSDEIPPNSRVKVSFLLPTVSANKIEFSGRIAWINQGFPRKNMALPQGFGVEILSINMNSVQIIQSYLEKN